MLSGTYPRAGDLSGNRGGDAAGVFGDDGCVRTEEREVAVSTCSSGTFPASAVAAGL